MSTFVWNDPYASTQLILKHSISYLSSESIFKTPPKKYFGHFNHCISDDVSRPLSYVSDTCCVLNENIVEGEIVLTTERVLDRGLKSQLP